MNYPARFRIRLPANFPIHRTIAQIRTIRDEQDKKLI